MDNLSFLEVAGAVILMIIFLGTAPDAESKKNGS